eukprot:8175347-Pyramimonas_sp.AAC.1
MGGGTWSVEGADEEEETGGRESERRTRTRTRIRASIYNQTPSRLGVHRCAEWRPIAAHC